jgi:hypothetical protein
LIPHNVGMMCCTGICCSCVWNAPASSIQ